MLAGKGMDGNRPPIGKPTTIDVTWRGRTAPRSLKLWGIGDATIKHLLYGRLRLDAPGPGYVHVPRAFASGDEFEQMTCERLITRYVKGHPKLEWHKPAGKRNEAGDCFKYAYAAACYLGIQSMREIAWSRREERISPKEQDLFAAPAAPARQQQAGAQNDQAPQQEAARAIGQGRPTVVRRPPSLNRQRIW